MGYSSRITNFEQRELKLEPGTTEQRVLSALQLIDEDYAELLRYIFDIEVDEETNEFYIEPNGEGGKLYDLETALEALMDVLQAFAPEGGFENRGLQLRFEVIGEDGDHRLFQSDGKTVQVFEGKITYPDAPAW